MYCSTEVALLFRTHLPVYFFSADSPTLICNEVEWVQGFDSKSQLDTGHVQWLFMTHDTNSEGRLTFRKPIKTFAILIEMLPVAEPEGLIRHTWSPGPKWGLNQCSGGKWSWLVGSY